MVAIYGHKWASHMGDAMNGNNLSESAKTWQAGLSGVSVDQIKTGFNTLVSTGVEWPPSLPAFRQLCVCGGDVPDLEFVISTLTTTDLRCGSLVTRYRHPLILAIAADPSVDTFFLRTAKLADAKNHVRGVYDRLCFSGFPGWPEHAFEAQKSIVHKRVRSKVDISAFRRTLNI